MSRWSQKQELKKMERTMARKSVIALNESGKVAHWAGNRYSKISAHYKKSRVAWGMENPLSY